jgi:hypothetical protein
MIKGEVKILNNHAHHKNKDTNKSRIVIGDTYGYELSHLNTFHKHLNGDKKCPHFSILRNGEIYRHFSINYYSDFLEINPEKNITIALENVSILQKINNEFFDIYNNKYEGEVFQRKWKSIDCWIPYTEDQFDSLIYLLLDLRNNLNFSETEIKQSNVFDSKHEKFKGVSYRSNYSKTFLDPNPSLNFKKIKQTLISEIQ